MAWTYSNWRTLTTLATRRARLGLHLQELEDALSDRNVSVGSDGKNLSRESIMDLIRMRQVDYDSMPADAGGMMKLRRGTLGSASANDDDD